MFKKDAFTDDHCVPCGFNMQVGQQFFPDSSRRNQYDRLDKFDNEVKVSTQYLPRTYYSSHLKNDFTLSTCNHLQDLNQKFQELESKMFEVEKCFKEANKREMHEMQEVQRLMENNNIQFQTECRPNIARSHRLFDVGEGRNDTIATEGIKEWCENQNSNRTEKNAFENRIAKDGSGDTPHLLSNERSSQNSCKTMIKKSIDKPSVHPLSRQGAKGLFTMDQIDVEENTNSTDVYFLEKSKKLILTLIDKELRKIVTKPKQYLPTNLKQTTNKLNFPLDSNKNLKIECIHNIEKELKTLKELELLEQ